MSNFITRFFGLKNQGHNSNNETRAVNSKMQKQILRKSYLILIFNMYKINHLNVNLKCKT